MGTAMSVLVAVEDPDERKRLTAMLRKAPGVDAVFQAWSDADLILGSQQGVPVVVVGDRFGSWPRHGYEHLEHSQSLLDPPLTVIFGHGERAYHLAVEAGASDVLEPDSTQERVDLCLERLERRLVARGSLPERLGFLQATDDGGLPRLVPVAQVAAVRSDRGGHGCRLYTEQGPLRSAQSLTGLTQSLAPQGFVRTDRQWLVRVGAVTAARCLPNRAWVLEVEHCPETPKVSRQRVQVVRRALASTGVPGTADTPA